MECRTQYIFLLPECLNWQVQEEICTKLGLREFERIQLWVALRCTIKISVDIELEPDRLQGL